MEKRGGKEKGEKEKEEEITRLYFKASQTIKKSAGEYVPIAYSLADKMLLDYPNKPISADNQNIKKGCTEVQPFM